MAKKSNSKQLSTASLLIRCLFFLNLCSCALWSRRHSPEEGVGSRLSQLPTIDSPLLAKDSHLLNQAYVQSQSDFHFTLGETLALEGKPDKAIEEFKLTLVYDPTSIMVRLRLAVEYLRQGSLSEAIELTEKAIQMDSKSTEGHMLLGGIYSSLKMYEEGINQYREILIYDPKNTEARVYIGALLAEQKKYEESIQTFGELVPLYEKEDKYKAYYYMGRVRMEQGGHSHLTQAEKLYTQALSFSPGDAETVISLARLYQMKDKTAATLKLLESYQEKFGPHPKVTQQLSQIYLEQEKYPQATQQMELLEGFEPDDLSIKFRLGLLYVEEKNYPAAIAKFENILTLEPQSDRTRFYLASIYEEIKNHNKAIEEFLKVPASSGFYSDAIIHAAHLKQQSGSTSQAVDLIKEAIEVRDDVPQFYAFYATLLEEQKKYSEAISMLTKVIDKFPDNTQLLFFLGSFYDRIGDKPQTLTQMKKVINIDANHIQALNYLAYTYAEMNQNLTEAENLVRKALSFQPKDAYILDTLGWVLFKQNKMSESIKILEAAYQQKSNESIIAEHLGDAYYGRDLVEKARRMYIKAVEMEKDEKKIEQIRQKLGVIEKRKERDPTLENRLPASSAGKANHP